MPSSKPSSTEPKWESVVGTKKFEKLEKFSLQQGERIKRLERAVAAQATTINHLKSEIAAIRNAVNTMARSR